MDLKTMSLRLFFLCIGLTLPSVSLANLDHGLFYRSAFPSKNSSCKIELTEKEIGKKVATYYQGNGVVEYASLADLLTQNPASGNSNDWTYLRRAFHTAAQGIFNDDTLQRALRYLLTYADLSKIRVYLPTGDVEAKRGSPLQAAKGLAEFDYAQPGWAMFGQKEEEPITPETWLTTRDLAKRKKSGSLENGFSIILSPSLMRQKAIFIALTWFHELLHIADLHRMGEWVRAGHSPPEIFRPERDADVWVINYQWFHFMIETRAYLLNIRLSGHTQVTRDENNRGYFASLDKDLFAKNLHLRDSESPLTEFGVIDLDLVSDIQEGRRRLEDTDFVNRRRLAELAALYQEWFAKVERELGVSFD
ncbi:MAG: hypothetical protein AAF202_04990 [Pseudomonadota bacterium]